MSTTTPKGSNQDGAARPSEHPAAWHVAIAVGLTALAAVMRIYGLAAESLWGDEINMVQFSLGDRPLEKNFGNASFFIWLLSLIPFDLTHLEILYRAPAALFGSLAAGVVYWTFHRSTEWPMAFAAGALFALCPYQIAFSQEVHSYSLLTLLTVLVMAGAVRLADRFSLSLATGLVLLSVAGMYVSLFSIFFLLPLAWIGLVSLLRTPRAERRRALAISPGRERIGWIALVAGIVLTGLPVFRSIWYWLLEFVQQLETGSSDVAYFQTPPKFTLGRRLLEQSVSEVFLWQAEQWILVGICWLLVAIGLVVTFVRHRALWTVGVSWIVLQLPVIVGFSYAARLDLGSRRFMTLTPALLLSCAAGLVALLEFLPRLQWRHPGGSVSRRGGLQFAVLLLVFALFASPLRTYYCGVEKPDYRLMADIYSKLGGQGAFLTGWKTFRLEFYGTPGSDSANRLPFARFVAQAEKRGAAVYVRPRVIRNRSHFVKMEDWFRTGGGVRYALGAGYDLWFACSRSDSECSALRGEIDRAIELRRRSRPAFCAAEATR